MIDTLKCFKEMIVAPARRVNARVELYEGSTLLDIFYHTDALKSFSVERMGEDGKFFGFGVCQKLQAVLTDRTRAINITKNNYLEVEFGTGCEYMYPYPLFRVDDIKRNENNNEITVIAYDPIYDSVRHKISEIDLVDYTILDLARAVAAILGLPLKIDPKAESSFMTYYPSGANFDGSETLREVMNAIAEATQTIYFINHNWELTFKRLGKTTGIDITKSKYFTLENKTNRTLTGICHATELGDNVLAGSSGGVVQYVRDNPFWEMREDIATLVNRALTAVGGTTINQFNCSWRGDFSLEIGDKISITTKDNSLVYGFVLNDTITYNGGLKENTYWSHTDRDAEDAANPTSIGDAIKHTYARVDKVNKRIDLVASEIRGEMDAEVAKIEVTTNSITQSVTQLREDMNGELEELTSAIEVTAGNIDMVSKKADSNEEAIGALSINTESINMSVSNLQKQTTESLSGLNNDINTLSSKVDMAITAEDVSIEINKALSNGTTKVETTTGYKFDETGLTVSKSGTEMTTTITEDGMTVKRNDEAMLTANNQGVLAENLQANNFLIIDGKTRFEYMEARGKIGCFWIGG